MKVRSVVSAVVVVVIATCACRSKERLEVSPRRQTAPSGPHPPKSLDDKTKELARTVAEAEALRNLGALEAAAKNSFQWETDLSEVGVGPFAHVFCGGTATTPAAIPSGGTAQTTPADWDRPPWMCLKFSLTDPQWCQYEWESNGKQQEDAEATITAQCDPNADGKILKATLKMAGSTTGDAVRVSLKIENGSN
jgi:hypothetical protein